MPGKRILGRTGWKVSPLALGTVALGVDYGIQSPGGYGHPSDQEAVALIHRAVDLGINLFDTAPTYGESERLLGMALKGVSDCLIATKITIPRNCTCSADLEAAIRRILEKSLASLQRETLDIVQIHNLTAEAVKQSDAIPILLKAKQEGKLRFLGASVYGEANALAVLSVRDFEVLQVALNILDQQMLARVFPAAQRAGAALLVRSVWLKGALTEQVQWLPPEMDELKEAVARIRTAFDWGWEDFPKEALRFALSFSEVSSVLVGIRTVQELEQACAMADAKPFSNEMRQRFEPFALQDERLVNPMRWPVQ
jgi:aryl-alcohol dehydrogenase-like predicted oxidoreductase